MSSQSADSVHFFNVNFVVTCCCSCSCSCCFQPTCQHWCPYNQRHRKLVVVCSWCRHLYEKLFEWYVSTILICPSHVIVNCSVLICKASHHVFVSFCCCSSLFYLSLFIIPSLAWCTCRLQL